MRHLPLAAALWLAAAGCGVCVEDKIASCYDHAVIERARSHGQEVAFFAVQGPLLEDPALPGKLRKQVESAAGVQRGSARVSVENGALSFAYDPRRTNAIAVADALEKRTGFSLGLLKIVDRSAP
jgi:hypothetical protein